MKKGIKLLICALCLVFCLGMLAGCNGNGDDATATLRQIPLVPIKRRIRISGPGMRACKML